MKTPKKRKVRKKEEKAGRKKEREKGDKDRELDGSSASFTQMLYISTLAHTGWVAGLTPSPCLPGQILHWSWALQQGTPPSFLSIPHLWPVAGPSPIAQ